MGTIGCPKCGNMDIQIMELLTAWKEIDDLKAALLKASEPPPPVIGFTNVELPPVAPKEPIKIELSTEQKDWKEKYDKIKSAYIHTRLEVSGSFGNWDYATRKRVLEHEISSELGFLV